MEVITIKISLMLLHEGFFYNLIVSICSRLIQAHAFPYHVLSIWNGMIFFGFFKKIKIQYFFGFARSKTSDKEE